jgi:hypothetical protein
MEGVSMGDKIQTVSLSGPAQYDFGDSTPDDWPRSYVAAQEYVELSRRIETMERDRRTAEAENETLLIRVKVLTAERDDYILKQKVWEGANDELRSENIRLNRTTQASGEIAK